MEETHGHRQGRGALGERQRLTGETGLLRAPHVGPVTPTHQLRMVFKSCCVSCARGLGSASDLPFPEPRLARGQTWNARQLEGCNGERREAARGVPTLSSVGSGARTQREGKGV